MREELVAYVVIATKGRPDDVTVILETLSCQTVLPKKVIVVGTREEDFGVANNNKNSRSAQFVVSKRPGATIQRNVGLEAVLEMHGGKDNFIIIYFDDDFRPCSTWIENALMRFQNFETAGLTGVVLADGINNAGISEEDAIKHLNMELPRNKAHWTAKYPDQEVRSVYGCNMAFSAKISRHIRFDEKLPAYSWQEDRDYSRLAAQYGPIWCSMACTGVHLGTKRGRVSGVTFGYSQIANPIYLLGKGTMNMRELLTLVARNMIANHVKIFFPEAWVDRLGRARGNWIAIKDLIVGRISPQRIKEL